MHYEVIGRGRPIIFLHSWVGSWRYWIPAMQTTSTSFRAYAMDMWGFGESAHEKDRYGLDKQSALLDFFLQEMGIGKVALVGHGLGGLVAMMFAMRYPNMVDRIMTVDMPLSMDNVSARLRTATPAELSDWLLTKNDQTEPVRTDSAKADPQAILTSFSSQDTLALMSRMANFSTPCLLVYGQNDPAITMPTVSPDALPHMSHMISLEQSGHFPMLDDVARFNRLLNDFLTLESGETPRDLLLKEEWKRRVR